MEDWTKELLGYGPLGAFAIFASWIFWKLSQRYIASAEHLHTSLSNAAVSQQSLCQTHAATSEKVARILEATVILVKNSDDIVQEILESQKQQSTLTSTLPAQESIERIRLAFIRYCTLCREAAKADPEEIGQIVHEHCSAMESILKVKI